MYDDDGILYDDDDDLLYDDDDLLHMMKMIFADADDDRHYICHVKPACVAECFVLLVSFW